MNLKPVRFEDEVHVRAEFQLETTGPNPFWYTLIAKFTGAYGHGSGGSADANYILGTTKIAVAIWHPAALILDLSELRYEWGDEMDWLLPPAVHIPAAVVVGPNSATAIATLMWGVDTTRLATEAEFVFDNLEAAWTYVREQKETGQSPTRRKVAPDRVLAAVEQLAGDAVQFTSGHSPETFRADKLTHHAVVQTVAMVGEAAGDLPASLRKRVPEVDWSELVRLGYHLRDHYYAVDLDQVWATVTGVFPALLPAVRRLMTELAARPVLQESP